MEILAIDVPLETENYIYENGCIIEKFARTDCEEARFYVDVLGAKYKHGNTNLNAFIEKLARNYGLWWPKSSAWRVRSRYLSRFFIAGYISALRRVKSGSIDIDAEIDSLISPTEVDVTKCY